MWKAVALAFAVSSAVPVAAAQQPDQEPYPSRPVRFVVPFTVGGSADNYARILAHKMTDMASGRVHLWFNGIAPAQAQIKAGKVRALAVTSASINVEMEKWAKLVKLTGITAD